MPARPLRISQELLHQQRVDVHQRGLEQVQREHTDLLGFLVLPAQVAFLAVEEVLVRRIPVLYHLQPLVNLLAHSNVGEVVADLSSTTAARHCSGTTPASGTLSAGSKNAPSFSG